MFIGAAPTAPKPLSYEKKSFPNIISAQLSFADFLFNNGNFDLGARESVQLYKEAMPFFNSVDIRATAFSEIPIRLWDKSKDEFIKEHPVLDLFAHPNADVSQNEFLYAYASFVDITGNSFLIATGQTDRPPLELALIAPQGITFGMGNGFGVLNVPSTIQVNLVSNIHKTFIGEEVRTDGFFSTIRFFTREKDNELWHTRQFNPARMGSVFWGMSKAKPVFLELQQYIAGNKTNLAMLKRGTRMSGAWVNNRDVELTDTQWSRLQEEAQKYKGEMNAGGTPVLDGVDFRPDMMNNRDMEFKDLQEMALSRTANIYKIPLALLLDSAMTLDNLKTSQLQLYDNAVLPLTRYLYAELTRFLLPRYPNSENLEFRFSEFDIPVLRSRILENAKTKRDLNVNTTDEIRQLIGDEELADGGDTVLIPANLVPLGSDAFTDDNLQKPIKSKFVELMQETKDLKGKRRYTDDEIYKIADSRGLT